MLRYWTAGESHGKALVALVDGFPAGVELRRRRRSTPNFAAAKEAMAAAAGSGSKSDRVEILSGIWHGRTLGSPIALLVPNKDYKIERMEDLDRPRPGHGDLSGAIKYLASVRGDPGTGQRPRNRRSRRRRRGWPGNCSSRFGIAVLGLCGRVGADRRSTPRPGTLEEQRALRDTSEIYSLNPEQDGEVKTLIDDCQKAGDTLGGIVEVRVEGVPFGLGTHAQWDQKLDGRLAQAVMAVQAIKGVEIGLGFEAARRRGSQVHDPIRYDPRLGQTPSLGFTRPTNNAGGLEAGMTNAQPIVVRAAMKPISTLARPLESVNLATRAARIGRLRAERRLRRLGGQLHRSERRGLRDRPRVVDKFGGDSLAEMQARWKLFHELARQRVENGVDDGSK